MEKKQKTEKTEKAEPAVLQTQQEKPKEFLTLGMKLLFLAAIGIALLLFFTVGKKEIPLFSEDTAVLFVNGNPITEAQIQAEMEKLPPYYQASGVDMATIRNAIIEQLIAKKLLLEEGAKQGMTATADDIQDVLNNMTTQAQITAEELEEKLSAAKMTLDDLKELIREQVMINKVIEQKVLADIQVTEEEIAYYYEQEQENLTEVRASHILVCYKNALRCNQNRTKEEAYALAGEILGQIKEEKKFSDLAKEYSDDPSGEETGGDLGWFNKGQMVPEFEEAVFALNVGEISEQPVETAYGYHIISVTDKKESLGDFKEEIVQVLTFEEQKTAVEAYIKMLKDEADIVYANQSQE